ncbi:MAG: hypothetical protein EBR82_67450 [Caulobacteraceae bacterium]|nr:hypothetical protein [Caulobacteraceae bacterium]
MVELATLELNAKTDGLTRGVTALKALEQQAAQTEAVTNKLTTGTEAVSKSLTMTSGNAKLFMQQLSQIAQQGAATGQWDMGSAFGVWGMAVGAIATVGLPLLVGALSNAGTAATTAKDAVEALQTAQKGLKESQDILSLSFADLVVKYGNYASAVRDAAAALAELQLAQAKADLANSLKDANGEISYLLEQTRAGFQNIRDEFGTTSEQTQTLAADFRAIRDAASIEDRLAAFAALSAHMKAIGVDTSKLPEALLQAISQWRSWPRRPTRPQTRRRASRRTSAAPAQFGRSTVICWPRAQTPRRQPRRAAAQPKPTRCKPNLKVCNAA